MSPIDLPADQASYWAEAQVLLTRRRQRKWDSFSWITVRALLSAINDVFSRLAPSLVAELRAEWMAQVQETTGLLELDELVIDRRDCASFVVIGDTGEQDASQYVVVPALKDAIRQDPAIGLVVVCSDVIYPSGDVNDYIDGYYVPYKAIRDVPIYALPGNHDWYDGLAGFMWHWCGQDQLPSSVYGPSPGTGHELPARLFWRRPSSRHDKAFLDSEREVFHQAQRTTLVSRGATSGTLPGAALQRSPYVAIQTRDVLLVCIDTGIDGCIDTPQAEWFVKVSQRPGPKVLVTGKPLLVNRQWHACELRPDPVWSDGRPYHSVGEVVEDQRHTYVATIGGDVHNFQHYERNGRPHIVSGGGGAYMSATHTINEAALTLADDERQEPALATSPTEAESLSHYGDLMLPRLWRLERDLLAMLAGLVGVTVAASSHALAYDLQDALGPATVALAALAFIRAVILPSSVTQTRSYRTVLGLVCLGIGAIGGTATQWLSPAHGQRLLIAAMAIVVGLGAAGQALRWTAWWRPAATTEARSRRHARAAAVRGGPPATGSQRPSRLDRVRRGLAPARPTAGVEGHRRFWVIEALILLALVPQLVGHRDWWLIGCTIGVAAVWAYGAWIGRRPKTVDGRQQPRTSWRGWGVVSAYGALAFTSGCLLYRVYPGHRLLGEVLIDLLVQTAIFVALVVAAFCAVIAALALPIHATPTPLARLGVAAASGAPSYPKGHLATRLGQVGVAAPWVLGVLTAVVLVVQFRWLPTARWNSSSTTVRDLPAVILVLLVLAIATPVVVDAVRRHAGQAYRLVLGAVTAVGTALTSWGWHWWATYQFRLVVGVLLVALLTLVATVWAHLVLVGVLGLLGDWPAHRDVDATTGPLLISTEDAATILAWRLGEGTSLPARAVVRRADIVSPGTDRPHGLLQKLVAEIFDSDRPPFFKNFVVCDTTKQAMTVTIAIVTGTPTAPPTQQIVVPLT